MLTLEQGTKLVKLARQAIESYILKKDMDFEKEKKEFCEPRGVFVTLLILPSKKLRGCIGFSQTAKPLAEAVVEAAKSAAFSDTRFEPLKKEELYNIIIEVSVLTEPELIQAKPHEIPLAIKTGTDGLLIQFSGFSGLLLPQVAQQLKWNSLEFLRATCTKASLPAETWLNPNCKIYKFQAQIFSEQKPNGAVIRKKEEVLP